MSNLKITETVLRDGHQSLIATRMRTEDMLPVLEEMDQIGYHAFEMWGGATFDSCLRFLDEDPWMRLKKINLRVKKTNLQMLLRGQNILGYKHYPDDILEKFIKYSIDNGIDIIRIFDALNDPRNMKKAIEFTNKYGAHAQGTIVYTISPIHDIDHYIKTAKRLKELGANSLCIKDMAGLLTPYVVYDLVKRLKNSLDIPIEIHAHCTSGMASMMYIKAIEAGVDIIDTALASFASGTSQPPTQSFVAALENSNYDTGLDLKALNKIDKHFEKIRGKHSKILGSMAIDPRVLSNQIPGGMLSNLQNQLKEQGMFDRYNEVLEEVPRVREDLGYPPLVTPTSQITGTQAVFNVVTNERYKYVSKELTDYIKGMYGRPPGEINTDVKKKVLEEGDEVITDRPANHLEPMFDEIYEKIKDIVTKEEDVLSYALFPKVAEKFLNSHYY